MGVVFNPLIFSGFDVTGSGGGGGGGDAHWEAPVANAAALPTLGNSNGDVRVTQDTSDAWIWNASASRWVNTGVKESALFGSTPSPQGYEIVDDNSVPNQRTHELVLQPADATNPGAVSVGAQSFGGAKTFEGDVFINSELDMLSHAIVNVIDPVDPQDVATKNYVDTLPSSGANTALSNLISPTAVNQDLTFNTGSIITNIKTVDTIGVRSSGITVQTGDASGVGIRTGNIILQSGIGDRPGAVVVQGGDSTGTFAGAGIGLTAGTNNGTGNGGSITILAGSSTSSGLPGDILIATGDNGTDRGLIGFQNGSEGTAGHVWTSIDTAGNGEWMAGSGGGANQTLSNLTAPTAINEDLIFDTGSTATLATAEGIGDDSSGLIISSGEAPGFNSGNVTVKSGDGEVDSGDLLLKSGDASSNSGIVELKSGDSSGGDTGNMEISTGAPDTGVSGNLTISTGDAEANASGTINITSGVADSTSGGVSIYTGDGTGTDSVTGTIVMSSGNATGTGASGDVNISSGISETTTGSLRFESASGQGTDGGSGSLTIQSGAAVGTGASGNFVMKSGDAVDSTSGSVNLTSGNTSTGESGSLFINSGSTSTGGNSGQVLLSSGNTTIGGNSGITQLITGNAVDGTSGGVNFATGAITGTGSSGSANISTGAVIDGDSGFISIATGAASGIGETGDIVISTGIPASGAQGKIILADGSEGLTGSIWTSSDTTGRGEWVLGGWVKYTLPVAAFSAASLSNDILVTTVPVRGIVKQAFAKHSTAFSGGGATTVLISFGSTVNSSNGLITDTEVTVAPASNVYNFNTGLSNLWAQDFVATEEIRAYMVSDVNIDTLTSGSIDLFVRFELIPTPTL